jgi:hypothetical protein
MAKLNLQKREIRIIALAAVLIVVLVGYRLMQGPWKAYSNSISEVTAAELALKNAQLTRALREEALRGKGELQQKAKARGPGWNLYQYLTGAVKQAELENRADIQSKDSPSKEAPYNIVQVTIKGASLEELVNLLHAIHNGDKLIILDSMNYLKPDRESKGLECLMTFISPKVGIA